MTHEYTLSRRPVFSLWQLGRSAEDGLDQFVLEGLSRISTMKYQLKEFPGKSPYFLLILFEPSEARALRSHSLVNGAHAGPGMILRCRNRTMKSFNTTKMVEQKQATDK
ncbi:hypothetical protein ACMFMG_000235 [Clarireedia jacksonii]